MTFTGVEYKLVITCPGAGLEIVSEGFVASAKLAESESPGDIVNVRLVPVPKIKPFSSVQLVRIHLSAGVALME